MWVLGLLVHKVGLVRELRVQLVAALGAHRDAARNGAERADEMAVAGIAGIGEQHFVALVQQHAEGEEERGGRAGGHDDSARGHVQPVTGAIETGDRLAQR